MEEVGEWNEMIAATFGAIKEVAQANDRGAESPIAAFPSFEHLEFKGQQNQQHLAPFLQAMKQLADRGKS